MKLLKTKVLTALAVCGIAVAATSPPGSTIPIIDATGASWALSSTGCPGAAQCVTKNGANAGYSASVIKLELCASLIYQENNVGKWWTWSGTTWTLATPPPTNCGGSSSSSSSSSGGSSSSGATLGIKVTGATLTDLAGNVVQLQGENVASLEILYAPSMWDAFYVTSLAQWQSIKTAWQMNVIRLPVNEYAWNNNVKSALGTPYQAIVKTAVANIRTAGMYVIIDLHWGAPNAYKNASCGTSPGCAVGQPNYLDADNAITFWTSVGSTYKNDPGVMFELFNEPYGDDSGNASSYTYLKNGGGPTPFMIQLDGQGAPVSTGVNVTVAGHQQLVTAIRATGATNVILYSCPVWDSLPSQSLNVKPTDPLNQLAATVHYATGANADYAAIQAAGVPVVMSEYYTMASRGGYPWAQSNKIGYIMCCGHNFSSNPTLVTPNTSENLLTNAPWSFNPTSVAWPMN